MMISAAEIAAALDAKATGKGWTARCPAHDDRNPSLAINEKDGRILLHCHAGCTQDALLTALREIGLWNGNHPAPSQPTPSKQADDGWVPILPVPADAPKPDKSHAKLGKISKGWRYSSTGGELLGYVTRFNSSDGGKQILPLTYCRNPNGELAWRWKSFPKPRPLFGLDRLAQSPNLPVLISEGELAADGASKLLPGYVAMTWPGGTNAVQFADWSPLAGRNISIWPDADEPGKKAAGAVAKEIQRVGGSIRGLLQPPEGVSNGWDAADALDQGWTLEQAAKFLRDAIVPIEDSEDPLLDVVCMADVEPEEIHWIWDGRIPTGKLTLVEGDPGEGKSFITLALATHVSRGKGLPGQPSCEPANVLLLSAEDGLADTVRPRLDQMGADLDRVFSIKGLLSFDEAGLNHLEEVIDKLNPAVIVIDPLIAYLGGGVDMHRANEVRAALSPLAALAESRNVAIVAVRHLTKSEKKAIYRGQGSIDFTASARTVLLVGHDPDDRTMKAIALVKTNVSNMDLVKPMGYTISGDGEFYWTGESDLTADRILASAEGDNGSSLDEATEFLRDLLGSDKVEAKAVLRLARENGISEKTLKRAKAQLKVRSDRSGFGKDAKWFWILPFDAKEAKNPIGGQEGHVGNLAPYGGNGPESSIEGQETHTEGLALYGDNDPQSKPESPQGDYGEEIVLGIT